VRILVVEDDRKVARFIEARLEQEGSAVDVLHDGTDAGEQTRLADYDAVVLDLMLPGRSGVQVLRETSGRASRTASGADPQRKDSIEERVRPRCRGRRLHGEAIRPGGAVARLRRC
jgi:CheY-like chemotaxis protein